MAKSWRIVSPTSILGGIREKFELGWNRVIELGKKYPHGFQFIEQYSFSPYIHDEVKQAVYTGGWCGPMNKLYEEAIQQKLFIPMNPGMMVQMHYGSFVYMLKAHLHGVLELNQKALSLGVPKDKALEWGNTRKGYWRIAGSPILGRALNNQYWESNGLKSLVDRYNSLRNIS